MLIHYEYNVYKRVYASKTIISFLKTVELGTFAAAAQSLGISAAAVGQNVTRLESSLGVKLFNRTTRELSLTDEGSLLYRRARSPIQELEEIQHVFAEQQDIAAGEITISCTKKVCETVVLDLVTEFSRENPKVSFSIDSNDAIKNIQTERIDVAFRIGAVQQQSIIARKISENPLGVYCSPTYKEKYGVPETIEELPNHNCLQYVFPGNQLGWIWKFHDGEERRVNTVGNFSFNDPAPLVLACKRGLGLIQIDQISVQDYLDDGSLISVLDKFKPEPFSLSLCYVTRDHMPLRIRRFIDFVIEKSRNSDILKLSR